MLTKENQIYVLETTKQLLPSVLDEIGFDSSLKEVGHSFGEKLEEELVNRLVSLDNRFAQPTKEAGKGKQTRKQEDLTFLGHHINVKFGYQKMGQPNMVSFRRLCESIHSDKIDSYWILSIDGSDNKIYFFNLCEHLDYTNTNYGTGQIMLKEKDFYKNFDQNANYQIEKKQIMKKLSEIDRDSYQRHVMLKEKQHKKQQEELFSAYL